MGENIVKLKKKDSSSWLSKAISIFIVFMIVISEMFVVNVISLFGDSATKGRDTTVYGSVIQGIFMVVGYFFAIYVADNIA